MSEPAVANPHAPPRSNQLVLEPGEPMESARHLQQMMILVESLDFAWRERDDFYVAGDMALYFSETQTRRNDLRAPDVFVVLDTRQRERRAWVTWEEDGQAPNVVIELLSKSTEAVDRGEKMRLYARTLRVGEYFLFDPFSGVLEGYELDALHGAYVRKQADQRGRLRCEQMGCYLAKVPGVHFAVEADWLRWMDDKGCLLPLPDEAANLETERANDEAERADIETDRANAQAERAKAALQRANAEAARARAALDQANVEAARADRLEGQLRALRAGRQGSG